MSFAPECRRFFFTVKHGEQLAQILTNFALNGGTAGASGSIDSCCWVRQFLGEKLEPFQCWRLRGLRGGWDGMVCLHTENDGEQRCKTKALLYRINWQMATIISVMVLRNLCINFCRPHLSYGLVRSKREYYHNCSLVVFLCSFL